MMTAKSLILDATGLVRPMPIEKIAEKLIRMESGDILEVVADCESFEKDVRRFCERLHQEIISVKDEGNHKKVQILVS
jgi:tRNA 2-thiouridine synthesizing protein A